MSDNNTTSGVQPAIDPSGVLDLARRLRDDMRPDDPTNFYHGKHQLVREELAKLDAFLAARGIVEPPPPSPQEIARQQVDALFQSIGEPLDPWLTEQLDNEVEALEALDPAELARRTERLRAEMGPAQHDAAIQAAKTALGGKWKPAVAAARHSLRVLGGVGRYRTEYEAAKARVR